MKGFFKMTDNIPLTPNRRSNFGSVSLGWSERWTWPSLRRHFDTNMWTRRSMLLIRAFSTRFDLKWHISAKIVVFRCSRVILCWQLHKWVMLSPISRRESQVSILITSISDKQLVVHYRKRKFAEEVATWSIILVFDPPESVPVMRSQKQVRCVLCKNRMGWWLVEEVEWSLSGKKIRRRAKRKAIIGDRFRWPNATVPYSFKHADGIHNPFTWTDRRFQANGCQ